MSSPTRWSRLAAITLALAGALWLVFPLTRPWGDDGTLEGTVAAMASPAWVGAHLAGMLGLLLMGPGVASVWGAVRPGPGEPAASAAVVLTTLGAGLTLPYFGAEAFGLHAAATVGSQTRSLLGLVDAVRFQPVAIVTFGLGLAGVAAGGVSVAVAAHRSDRLHGSATVAFVAALVLLLPQFLAQPPVRVAHGVLMAAGCAWLAGAVWRSTGALPRTVGAGKAIHRPSTSTG